jgi:hypothetical protein
MALTRKSLKAMGLTDEQVDSIVEMHTETVDGLKDKLKTAEEKANKLDDVQKELDGLKANSGDDYKAKYEAEKKAFADYKADQTAKETKAAKEKAVKAYFEGKNITGANLDIAMRGCRDEIGAIELDGGKIKDTAALDALVGGTFAGLVVTKSVHGAQTANPPANNGGKNYKTKEEILAIKDRAERQNAIAENHEMFGF